MGRYFDVRKPFREEDEVIVKTTFSNAPKASQDPVDWGDHTKLTIKQATALSYALSPLKIDDHLDDPNDAPDLLRDVFHARKKVIEQAISCGIIRAAPADQNSGEIHILTEDVVRFFQGGPLELPVPPQSPLAESMITTSEGSKPMAKELASPDKETRSDRLSIAIEAAYEELWKEFFEGFVFPYGFFSAQEYTAFLIETCLKPLRVELFSKYMKPAGEEGLAGWIRTT